MLGRGAGINDFLPYPLLRSPGDISRFRARNREEEMQSGLAMEPERAVQGAERLGSEGMKRWAG